MKMQTQTQFRSSAMTLDVVAIIVDLDSCPIYPGVF